MKMLPRIDYPELLLEVHGHTGMFDAFGHITGSTSRRADLDISLAALMWPAPATSAWDRW